MVLQHRNQWDRVVLKESSVAAARDRPLSKQAPCAGSSMLLPPPSGRRFAAAHCTSK